MDANRVAKLLDGLMVYYDPWDCFESLCPDDIINRSKLEELADMCIKYGAKPIPLNLTLAIRHNDYNLCAKCLDNGLEITEDEFWRALIYKSDNILRLMVNRKIKLPMPREEYGGCTELFTHENMNCENPYTDEQRKRILSCLKILVEGFHIFDECPKAHEKFLKAAKIEDLEECVAYLDTH